MALFLAACAVAGGLVYCRDLEARYIHALAPEFTEEKLQGAALQKEAFRQGDLLVLYGSSELVKEMPNNAVEFFSDYPTGFRVFPVGKPGTTALAILQKLAAVGAEARDRKLVYSISPGWYFTEQFDPKYYEGNFSDMQALELVFSRELSHGLKRDVARRMIDYPTTTGRFLVAGICRGPAGRRFDV
jgi:D-alanine transfer protein